MRYLPAACLLLSLPALFAQGDRGTITGTVTDATDAVIAQAKVVARNAETGAAHETTTTTTGNYTLPQVPAGVYDISIEAAGFTSFTQQGVRVFVAQTARIDVALKVGSTAESVTEPRLARPI